MFNEICEPIVRENDVSLVSVEKKSNLSFIIKRRLEKNKLGFSTSVFGQFKLHFVQYII